MSLSDGSASSSRRGEGSGAGTQAPDDATNPAGLAADAAEQPDLMATRGRKTAPAAAASPWDDDSTREQPPVPAYTGGPAFGPTAPGPAGGVYAGSMAGPPQVTPASSKYRGSAARRARLKVSHMGPLSVFRIALTFSLCMFIVLLVAIGALWFVLDSSGVFTSIIDTASTLTSDNKNTIGVAPWLSFGRVMLITVVLGAANVIAFTLLSTIGALLYNLCSDFVGGIEVTLVER